MSQLPLATDDTIACVARSCNMMQNLDVSECFALTNESLRSITTLLCPAQLQTLTVSRCNRMTADGIRTLLRSQPPRLQCLYAAGVDNDASLVHDKEFLVDELPVICPSLLLLRIGKVPAAIRQAVGTSLQFQ